MAPNRPRKLSGPDVSIGSIATEMTHPRYVRFTPDSDRIADIAGCLKRVKNRHRSGRRRGSRQRRWGDAFSAGCPGMEILDAADSWPNRGTRQRAAGFRIYDDERRRNGAVSDQRRRDG